MNEHKANLFYTLLLLYMLVDVCMHVRQPTNGKLMGPQVP